MCADNELNDGFLILLQVLSLFQFPLFMLFFSPLGFCFGAVHSHFHSIVHITFTIRLIYNNVWMDKSTSFALNGIILFLYEVLLSLVISFFLLSVESAHLFSHICLHSIQRVVLLRIHKWLTIKCTAEMWTSYT